MQSSTDADVSSDHETAIDTAEPDGWEGEDAPVEAPSDTARDNEPENTLTDVVELDAAVDQATFDGELESPCSDLFVCCDDAICWGDSCGGVGDKITDCPLGCADGKCVVCSAFCAGIECGSDGCGGSCGECSGGMTCQSGTCACAPDAAVECCGDAVCTYDSCGNEGVLVTDCPFGCEAGACAQCVPDASETKPACCGAALCWLDSCGVTGAKITDCPDGCVDAHCISCEQDCAGRQCGADGCGGLCGECPADRACDADGQCVCFPSTDIGCEEGDIWMLDSCGVPVQKITDCPYGCDGGVCLPCVPECTDKFCGADGCGGTCGSCPNGLTCQNATCAGDMVTVPAGPFWMGCGTNVDPDCMMLVDLPAFQIDRYEVTWGEFYRCQQAGFNPGCRWYDSAPPNPIPREQSVLPVTGARLAANYCEWRGGRLCSNEEWEKAARGVDDERTYPWGNEPPTCGYAAIKSCGLGGTPTEPPVQPVGSKPVGASPYGVMDMAGNAAEMVNSIVGYAPNEFRTTLRGGNVLTDNVSITLAASDPFWGIGYNYTFEDLLGSSGDLIQDAVGFRCCKSLD